MKVAFRADASTWIGSGHIMRCATLAQKLRSQGAEIHFVCRRMPGDYFDWLAQKGFNVHELKAAQVASPGASDKRPAHVGWLGVPPEQEREESLAVLVEHGHFDWLIVDHYALSADWERAMRTHAAKIMVIDDLADRPHDCDLLLDQNLFSDSLARYAGKVPQHCKLMLGPEYALLQDEYAELHPRIPPRKGEIKRILVFFGAADTANLTGKTITALQQVNCSNIIIDVILSVDSPHLGTICAQIRDAKNIKLHTNLPTLASLVALADLAIGAGGTSTWERCCLGLPTLVITLAENQHYIAASLATQGLIRWIGPVDEITHEAIRQAAEEVLSTGVTESWSADCRNLVDGLGAKKVSALLTASADMQFRLRHATLDDEALLLRWANDPVVRTKAFSPEPINAETHHQWFYSRLRDVNRVRLYISETLDDIPIGQVRFENNEKGWEIDYSIDALYRGLGLGRRVLEQAIQKLRSEFMECQVYSRVMADNRTSRRVFESLHFHHEMLGEVIHYKLSEAPLSEWSMRDNALKDQKIVLATPHARHDALERQLQAHGLDVTRIRTREDLSQEYLQAIGTNWIFFPHWSWKIPKQVFKRFECVIFHMADLPYGRGGSPLQNLIVRGYQVTMLNALRCVEGLDAGPIYLTRPLSLLGTAEEILLRASALMEEMILEIVHKKPTPEPQTGDPVVFSRRRPEDGNISQLTRLEEACDYIRMLDAEGYPNAFLETEHFRFGFTRASLKPDAVLADVRIIRKKA